MNKNLFIKIQKFKTQSERMFNFILCKHYVNSSKLEFKQFILFSLRVSFLLLLLLLYEANKKSKNKMVLLNLLKSSRGFIKPKYLAACRYTTFKEGTYEFEYKQSIENPELYWQRRADEIEWFKKPTKIIDKSNSPGARSAPVPGRWRTRWPSRCRGTCGRA